MNGMVVAELLARPTESRIDGGDRMKNSVILLLVFGLAACTAGCGRPKEAFVAGVNNDAASNREPWQRGAPGRAAHAKHGDHGHHHGFANPAELAKTWNDPERDTWQHPEEIVAALALKPGMTVADIGAGTGYMAVRLSRAVGKEGTVIAIDAEAAMINYLASRRDDLGPAEIVPRKVGMDDPELQSDSVECVLTLDTWHHIRGREAYARKVHEGLKRGGRFVVVDWEVDADSGPPAEMRIGSGRVMKELELAGFRGEIVTESMPRHYMVVGHKD